MTSQDFVLMPAVCLDLDGTIRYSRSGTFINRPADVALFADVEDKLWEYRNKGFLIFGVSNQGGVAFGYKTVEANRAEIDATVSAFQRNPFHAIKCSFNHPIGTVEPYKHRSLLRKPNIGMLALLEVESFEKGIIVDWDHSLFVGDRLEDLLTATSAGLQYSRSDIFFNRAASDTHPGGQ